MSGWSPCPRPSRRMAPRGWSGRWNAVRMRRGRWSRPGSGWNRPEKTWVPVWRIGLCWIAASGCTNWPVGRLAAANALAAIPGLCADRERALAALQRELAGLGPDWTAERVQRIGRPLSLREALERQAEQRRSAVSDMENAQAAVRRIAEDTKALESELEEQMRQAADVPRATDGFVRGGAGTSA